MLKAVYKSSYRNKQGEIVCAYVVTGPAAEIAEYQAIESLRRNRPIEQLPNDNGRPIISVSLAQELRAGRTTKPSYNLVKSFDGLRYFRDTMEQEIKDWQEIEQMAKVEKAKQLAANAFSTQVSTPRPVAAPVVAPSIPAQTIEDEINAAVGEGALAEHEAGGETLAD